MLKEHFPNTGMCKVLEKGGKILGPWSQQADFVSVKSHHVVTLCTHKCPDLSKCQEKPNEKERENFLHCTMTF